MIQAVKLNQNLSFKGNEQTQAPSEVQAQEPSLVEDKAFVEKAKDTFTSLKDSAVDTIKDVNQVTCTSSGIIKGIAGGAVGAVGVGVLGKNIKLAKGDIAGTIKGVIKDLTKGTGKAIKFAPELLKKSPVQNLKKVAGLPTQFFKTYLKGHKLTAALATSTALGIAAFKTIQGKLNGNLKNANVDHRLNRGHIEA